MKKEATRKKPFSSWSMKRLAQWKDEILEPFPAQLPLNPDLSLIKQIPKPRQNYQKYPHETEIVLQTLRNDPGIRGLARKISKASNIPLDTIKKWKKKLKKDINFSPIHEPQDVKRGRPAFTHEERLELYHEVRAILSQGYFFSNADFRLMALRQFYSKYPNKEFECSPRFIAAFKKEFRLSSLHAHFKRRPTRSAYELKQYSMKLNEIQNKFLPTHIFNADETAWRLTNPGILTWGLKGLENQAINSNFDEKKNFTSIATISADGQKMPLVFVAKGITERCEVSQIGGAKTIVINGTIHYVTHSKSGWVNTEIWKHYIELLRIMSNIPITERICLIADKYKCHYNRAVLDAAKEKNIKLLFIPSGCTDLCQPLDVSVFGALKVRARRFWHEQPIEDRGNEISIAAAVQQMGQAWSELSSTIVLKAFDKVDRNLQDCFRMNHAEKERYMMEYYSLLKFGEEFGLDDLDSDDDFDFMVESGDEDSDIDELYESE